MYRGKQEGGGEASTTAKTETSTRIRTSFVNRERGRTGPVWGVTGKKDKKTS